MKANILKRPIGKVITVWCAFATLTTSFTPVFAGTFVLPEAELNGATGLNGVTSGSAVGKITGNGGDAVLDWNSLSIYKGHSLTFENGKSFYNVVSGSTKSELLGTLIGDSANVYIFNPNGILIGGNAQINVSGIFGAYAMGISRTTLDTWLENVSNVGSTQVESKNTGLVEVESGALIQAAAIELAGKGISLNNATFTTNGKEDESGNIEAVTKLTAGGMLVLDQVSGGRVSVDISDESSFATDGIDLMGDFSKALTVQTAANGNVKVVGATSAGGDVTITAGSISESDRVINGASIVTTDSGKLTATATAGDIVLDREANNIQGEVSLTAEKGAATFKNSAETTSIGDVKAKSVAIEAAKDLTVNELKSVTVTEGDAKIVAGDSLTVDGNISAVKGNTTLTAVNDITVNGSASAGTDVTLGSTEGAITVAGAIMASSVAELTAKNDITVENGLLNGVGGKEGVSLESTEKDIIIKGTVTASEGDVIATAANDVTVSGTITANDGDVELTATAGAATVSGSVLASEDVTISAGTAASVSGTIDAGTMRDSIDGDTVIGGDVEISGATVEVTSDGTITAAAALTEDDTVTGGNVVLTAAGTADGDKDITVAGEIYADNDVTATAANNVTVSGEIYAGNDVAATAANNITIDEDAMVVAGGAATLNAQGGAVTINNALILAGDTIDIDATGDVTIKGYGFLATGKDIAVDTTEGSITVQDESTLIAGGGDVALTATKGKVAISSTDDEHCSSVYAEGGDVKLSGATGVEVAENANITAIDVADEDGNSVGGNVELTATSVDETLTAVEKNITIAGTVTADKSVTATAANNVTVSGIVTANDGEVALDAQGGEASVSGKITATDDVTVNAKKAVSVSGAISAGIMMDGEDVIAMGGDVKLSGATVEVTSDGTITAMALTEGDTVTGGNVELTAASTEDGDKNITIAGTVEADKSVTATAANNVTIQGTDAENKATVTAKDGKVTIDAQNGAVTVDKATVTAVGEKSSIIVNATKNVTVSDESSLDADYGISVTTSGGAVEIKDSAQLDAGNNVGITAATGIQVLDKANVEAAKAVTLKTTGEGDITIKGVDADNKAFVTADNGAVTIKTADGAVTVDNADITASGDKGSIIVNATKNVTVSNESSLDADYGVSVTTSGGAVEIKDSAQLDAGNNVGITAATGIQVLDKANVEAAKAVTLKTTGEGDITIKGVDADNKAFVAADNGAVTIKTADGAVTVDNADITASGDNGSIIVNATKNVTVSNESSLDADYGISVTTSGGAVEIKDSAKLDAGNNVGITAATGIQVLNKANVKAAKAVTLKSTGTGDITINTENSSVTAQKGAVTIAANEGAVTINKTTVTANGTDNGTIDIDATKGVTVDNGATLTADKDIDIVTTGGNVTATEGTTLTAKGNLVVNAANESTDDDGNITIGGVVTVTGTSDLDAKGSIVAANEDNDFGKVVDATATKGEVALKDKNSISLGKVVAGTSVDVTAAEGIEVVENGGGVDAGESVVFDAGTSIAVNDKVHSGDTDDSGISFTAKDSIAVNAEVRTEAGNIFGKAEEGDIAFGANGSMWANGNGGDDDGSVTLIAAKNIDSANKGTAITAKDTINLYAGENIGSPLNVSAKYLNVDAGGSANIAMKKGAFNENGDLAVDDSKSSIKTGKDLKLNVEGNLSTPDGGVLRVGNNLDLTVNSATPEVNVTLGGSTITAANKTQPTIAIKTVGGTQFPEVIGSGSDTAVIIDGRVAGGDSSLFSILESYEAQAAIGMTPDIRGAVLEKTPKAYYDQKLHVNDVLPHVWDEQLDDKEVVPQEVSSKDAQATDTVAMR